MTMLKSNRHNLGSLRHKLVSLGLQSDEELDDVLSHITVRACANPSQDIIAPGQSPRHSTVLLTGIAYMYERLADGNRQIYAFQYPGDFCDLHRHVLPQSGGEVAVAAATPCSIGTIDHDELEQLISRYPSLGRALWRATMLEASMFQKRLLYVGRQPALRRVAHLLCEQLARQAAAGIDTHTIPLSQIDVADATGLSIVHVNRIFKELQQRGFLSKQGRTMKVTQREQLVRFAGFDGGYLNMPQLLSRWRLEIPNVPTRLERPATAGLARPSATGIATLVAQGRSDDEAQSISPPP